MVQADVGIDSTQVIAEDSTADIKAEESLILRQKLVDQILELERLKYQLNQLLLDSYVDQMAQGRIQRKAETWDYFIWASYIVMFITAMVVASSK